MRRLLIALTVIGVSCSGGEAGTTVAPTTPTTVAATTTTTTATPATTTTSTTAPSTTTTTTVPEGLVVFTHERFSLRYPDMWTENPEFPGDGVAFVEDHTAFALPATSFSVTMETREPGFDLDEHIDRLQEDLAFFVPDFRVLESGEETIDGVRSLWFQYAEDFDGFPTVIREQVALREDVLVSFTLISPVEFFEFDVDQAVQVVDSFRFA